MLDTDEGVDTGDTSAAAEEVKLGFCECIGGFGGMVSGGIATSGVRTGGAGGAEDAGTGGVFCKA